MRIALLLITFAGSISVWADSLMIAHEGEALTLKAEGRAAYQCDRFTTSEIVLCLDGQDSPTIQVNEKIYELIRSTDWFRPEAPRPKSTPAQQLALKLRNVQLAQASKTFTRITMRCHPDGAPPAVLHHVVWDSPKLELELDCNLKDPKVAVKYIRQAIEYARKMNSPTELPKLRDEMAAQAEACLAEVEPKSMQRTGENSENPKLPRGNRTMSRIFQKISDISRNQNQRRKSQECQALRQLWEGVLTGEPTKSSLGPARYCLLTVAPSAGSWRHSAVLPVTLGPALELPAKSIPDSPTELACDEEGFNCLDKNDVRQGHYKTECNQYGCEEGDYLDGLRQGHWKMDCKQYGCSEGEFKDGLRTGQWKENCDQQYGCDEGEIKDYGRQGRWKTSCGEFGCEEGEYKDSTRNGRWKEDCNRYGCSEGEYKDGVRKGHWKQDCNKYGCEEGEYYFGTRLGNWRVCYDSQFEPVPCYMKDYGEP